MADTDLSPNDVREAQLFMQQFLLALLEDADITEGSAEYDHLVKGFAYLFAYLRKQIGVVQARQSLLSLIRLPSDQNADEAADAILSNLYQSRDQGQVARGPALIHLSTRTDVVVRTTSRFFKTRTLYYLVDSTTDYLIPASRLRPNVDASGTVVDWVGTVPLVASRPGTAYNLAPGRFVNFERFNPFVTYVENAIEFQGGLDVETTSNFISRASAAVSLQALINARSNTAILSKLFPAIEQVLSIGNGDPEMMRDVIREASSGITLHIGGHTDILVRTPVREVSQTLTVGDRFARPDDLITVFRHDNTVDFTTGVGLTGGKPVVPGDVLVIDAGLVEAPFQYVVTDVAPTELRVQAHTPFSAATDEFVGTPPILTYTIGNDYPFFANKHSGTGNADTSRSIAEPNTVMLSGGPVYRVKKIEIRTIPAGLEAYADPASGTLLFSERANTDPAVPSPGSPLQYRVKVLNPDESQSAKAVTQIEIGWPGVTLDGSEVEVTYDTLTSFGNIDAYVVDPQNRPTAADTLVRAAHPVYLSMTVPYALNSAPTPFRGTTAATFDEDQATQDLVQFVNAYNGTAVMDVSLLTTEARANADTISAVYPFVIDYELLGPDGRVFRFSTTDRVTVFPDGTHGAALTNPADFGLDPVDYFADLAALLRSLGISDRTVRYLTSSDEVSFLRRV